MTRVIERHRHLIVLRGTRAETASAATRCVAGLDHVLWVSDDPEGPRDAVRTRAVRKLLGRSYDAVVLDLHDDIDPDTLGRAHGFVWGGGGLILRLPDDPREIPPPERLCLIPHGPTDIGRRFRDRFFRCLDAAQTQPPSKPIRPVRDVQGNAEQRGVVERLTAVIDGPPGRCAVLVADRGRGKSSALGLALRSIEPTRRIALTGPVPDAVGEVVRFAGERVEFVEPRELSASGTEYDVVIVDEAAQLPVPWLRRLVREQPDARFVFATTTHGYEGTGRGFALRFVEWLDAVRDVERLTLEEPIRWAADDPVEAFVFDALLLDADIASPTPVRPSEPSDDASRRSALANVVVVDLARETLVEDSALLRQFFGLLVQAHYRTTPGDLERLLDAPNVRLHALLKEDIVLGATLVALEGCLDPQTVADIHRGRIRIRGHALPDTFVTHLGHPESGRLEMVRSVRIAVHPEYRRLGLGTTLVDHVHATYSPDLFGTLFGATAELVEFRRQSGYEVVRLGASRGARTGEPAVVMARPETAAARELVRRARGELARDLPLQMELLRSDGEPALSPDLESALFRDLGPPVPLTDHRATEMLRGYVDGPRTFESVATAVISFVETHADRVEALSPEHAGLVRARVIGRSSWAEAATNSGYPSVPAAMRALRVAVRAMATEANLGDGPM